MEDTGSFHTADEEKAEMGLSSLKDNSAKVVVAQGSLGRGSYKEGDTKAMKVETPSNEIEVPLAGENKQGDNQLRHRGPNKTLSAEPSKKKKKKKLLWVRKIHDEPSSAQSQVFMEMQLRKMKRRIHGRKVKANLGAELCFLFTLIFVIIILGIIVMGPDYVVEDVEVQEDVPSSGPSTGVSIVLLVVWVLLGFVILSKAPFNPWFRMLKWMVVYIPLIWAISEFAWSVDNTQGAEPSLLILMIVSECLTLIIFVSFYKLYPTCLKSNNFGCFANKHKRLARFSKLDVVSDWTMTYGAIFMDRERMQKCDATCVCKYEGETDPQTGLPQGVGRWLDDSWEGETITGYWKQGHPVAPFSSWSYGTDDAVAAVRVAYFNATDDPYHKNEFMASNANTTPTCGVGSTECSVSGAFYQHLPEASVIEGPYESDGTDNPDCYKDAILKCIKELDPIGLEEEARSAGSTSIEINVSDTRGIQVVGHTYEPTGSFFDGRTDEVTVKVKRDQLDAHLSVMSCETNFSQHSNGTVSSSTGSRGRYASLLKQPTTRFARQTTMHLPKAQGRQRSFFGGHMILADIEESNDELDESKLIDEEKAQEKEDEQWHIDPSHPEFSPPEEPMNQGAMSLHVENWLPAEHKDALIFLPGYNSCTRDRLESFGQFLAMSKLSSKVYPFVYCWPGSVGPGYFQATIVAGNEKNFDNFHKLVASIRAAGIRHVHLMTHSMGAQCLLGAFQDERNERGEVLGRSKASRCFQLDPSFSNELDKSNEDEVLICKSITLLNPDFPLEAFVDRGFLTLRRICRTVTVVGDRNDGALWWSSLLNGYAERKGFNHSSALRYTLPVPEKPRSFRLQERLGRSIDGLYFPQDPKEKTKKTMDDPRLVYQEIISQLIGAEEDPESHQWLDLDVIDMTGLDTNIAGLRHTGFNLNGMLLKDLEELLTTGRRAMKRNGLVYRDGNMFSYAHAPSFVAL